MQTSLQLVKLHLNLEGNHDNALLTHYADAAEAWIAAHTGQSFTPSPLATQAVLLLTAHAYETREAATFSNPFSVPFGVHDVLSPLKDRITGHIARAEVQP